MAEIEIGISDTLDDILQALLSAGLNLSVVEPDGVAHGFMTTHKDINPDGSESLWFGLRRDGDCFRFDDWNNQVFNVYGGDQWLYRFETLPEVKAFLLGKLIGFTGRDVREIKEAVQALAEDDPYRLSVELHRTGWCPLRNG